MRRRAGFTMVELIVVMILIGVLAAIGIPRLMGDKTTETAVFHDQVVSAMRRAQKLATGHRRAVCVTLAARAVTIRIKQNAGDTACTLAVTGLDDADYQTADTALAASVSAGAACAQTTSTLYFQPDGRIGANIAGTQPACGQVTVTGASATRAIQFDGRSGYVE